MGLSEDEGTLFWGPYNKDPTIKGTILGSPILGSPHIINVTAPLGFLAICPVCADIA